MLSCPGAEIQLMGVAKKGMWTLSYSANDALGGEQMLAMNTINFVKVRASSWNTT